MRLTGKAFVYGLAATAVPVVGCSSNSPERAGSTASIDRLSDGSRGEIALELTLPGGESINSVNYTVNGPSNAIAGTYAYPLGITNPSFVIADVPPGIGYSLGLACTSADGRVACTGSNPATLPVSDASPGFNVAGGVVTNVNVVLTCTVTDDAGSQ